MTVNDQLWNAPCLRTGLMWGIGTGIAVGLQRFRMTKHVRSACDWGVMSFMLVSVGARYVWYCSMMLFISLLRYLQNALFGFLQHT